jgi:hypothetical protein
MSTCLSGSPTYFLPRPRVLPPTNGTKANVIIKSIRVPSPVTSEYLPVHRHYLHLDVLDHEL